MDTHELAWAAGFFDGEGHVGFTSTTRTLRLGLSQTDRIVLDRFRRAVGGLGSVCGPFDRTRRNPNEHDVYYYQSARFEHIQAVMAMLWKWLSPVKRAQTVHALNGVRDIQVGLRLAKHWLTCRRGHPRTPENVKIVMFKGYECRRCVQCDRERGVKFQRQRALAAALIVA